MTSRASAELIDATLRSVHHALASSIQSVRNRVFLAERKLAGDDAQEQLRMIERHVARAEQVMRRLLVLTPALAPPKREATGAGALADRALESLGGEVRARVALEVEGGDPIEVDPAQVASAIAELVRNAVTHAPEGESVALEIGARDGSLVVSVRGGVSRGWPDPVERAFEPLVSEASERLGLGLAAVRLVAEQHGGSVELRAGRPETDAPTHVRLVIPAPP